MSDLSSAASKIGDKIVDILDIFDLSFFISGAVGMGALLVAFPDNPLNPLHGEDTAGIKLFGLVLGSYVLGLVAFAFGRWIRGGITWFCADEGRELGTFLSSAKEAGFDTPPLATLAKKYFGYRPPGGLDRAAQDQMYRTSYTRMWAHTRATPELGTSLRLLNRYWILAASYDGIGVAVLLWGLLPLKAWNSPHGAVSGTFGFAVILLLVAGMCWRRALTFKVYQIQEMVATSAQWLAYSGRAPRADLDDKLLGIDAKALELEIAKKLDPLTVTEKQLGNDKLRLGNDKLRRELDSDPAAAGSAGQQPSAGE